MLDTFVAIDIETTGLSPELDKIIEIGAIKVKDSKIIGEYSSLINPNIHLTDKIITLTGITDELLADAPNRDKVLLEFLDFAGDDPLLGHNILFDYSFLKVNYHNIKIAYERYGMDTLMLSRKLHSEQISKSLSYMCGYYNIKNEHAHRAFDDAKAAYELFYKLRDEFDQSIPEIFNEKQLIYKIKKNDSITARQKIYLNDLAKYHKIELEQPVSNLTKSEASRLIDKIILSYGRII